MVSVDTRTSADIRSSLNLAERTSAMPLAADVHKDVSNFRSSAEADFP